MCIIFLHSDPLCLQSNYKLILAANRDEYFARPSQHADFLSDNSNILCGVDLKSNVKGGTWLGVTRQGKFGCITNYLTPEVVTTGKPRGSIVRNYLESSCSVDEYIQRNLVGQSYRPCSFIGGEFLHSGNEIEIEYFSEQDSASPYKLNAGSHVLGCTNLSVKWKKMQHGSSIFKNIIYDHLKQQPSDLTNVLIKELLSDTTRLFPDDLILNQCQNKLDENFLKSYCSVMVDGLDDYGTVAHTVILVDKDNHLFFTEKSLNFTKNRPLWQTHSYEFLLELDN